MRIYENEYCTYSFGNCQGRGEKCPGMRIGVQHDGEERWRRLYDRRLSITIPAGSWLKAESLSLPWQTAYR